MKRGLCAVGAQGRATWLVAAALLVSVPAPAMAQRRARDVGRDGASSWETHRPRPNGWLAGSVASGTGYRHAGGSQRVREVQRRLNRLHYGAVRVDGLFGPRTDASVRTFQTATGLTVDGIVGPQTLRELRSRTRRAQQLVGPGTGYRRPGASDRVRDVQRRLDRLGHHAGDVDGLFGPRTEAAVRGFQADRGLVADGVVGPKTARVLGAPTLHGNRGASGQGKRSARRPLVTGEPGVNHPWRLPVLLVAALILVVITGMLVVLDLVPRRSPREPGPLFAPGRRAAAGEAYRLDPGSLLIPPRRAKRTENHPGRRTPAPTQAAPAGASRPLEWVGARVHLSEGYGADRNVVHVEPEIFGESALAHCETRLLDDRGLPFAIPTEDFEEELRRMIVGDWVPRLEQALRGEGIDVRPEDLEGVPLVIELTPGLRRRLALEHAIAKGGEPHGD